MNKSKRYQKRTRKMSQVDAIIWDGSAETKALVNNWQPDMAAQPGDMIVRDDAGTVYPYEKIIFDKLYTEV